MASKLIVVHVISAVVMFVVLHGTAHAGSDIVPPHPTYHPNPEYSEAARKANLQGACVLRVEVGTDGAVHDVRVERSLERGLDEKAIEAVRSWKFEPALKNGNPIADEITVEVSFRLGADADARQKLLNALPPPVEFPISTTVEACPDSLTHRHAEPLNPEVRISDVMFDGTLEIPLEEQNQIAMAIKRREYWGSADGVTDEALELVREAWQDRGYFKVQVTGESKIISSNPVSSRIALNAHIDEGEEYRLAEITFRGNKAISNTRALRDLFPVKDGEIANRQKIAEGLESLRKAYMVQGFINVTFVPEPRFDSDERLVSFDIDVHQGKQFFVSSINLIGGNTDTLEAASRDLFLRVGQVYNQNLIDLFFTKHPVRTDESHTMLHLSEQKGTADITLDLRHCSAQ
jgi:TonB family protein